MGPNAQSLICSIFAKVCTVSNDYNRIITITIDQSENCKQLLRHKLLKQHDISSFWSNLVEDFRKLINNLVIECKSLENVDNFDELFPSLTSNDDGDNETSSGEGQLDFKKKINEENINIERRWNVRRKKYVTENLNQIVERIENSQKDNEKLIEIMEDLFQGIDLINDNNSEMKIISHICGVKTIENPLLFHVIMEECLSIYYCQSDSNQLERLRCIIQLFNFFTTIFRIKHLDLCSLKNFLLFTVEEFLPIISIFCFSYQLRDAAFEFMKTLSNFPFIKEGMESNLLKENDVKWFEIIPEKKIIQDSLTLGKSFERWFFGRQTDCEEEAILNELAKKINEIMSEFPNGEAFIKLSHRSPKDAAFKVNHYDSMVEEMVKQWNEMYGLEIDSSGDRLALKHEKYQSAITQICAQQCMKVKSGEEFINLMKKSYRSHVDLTISLNSDAFQYQNNESIPIQIVIREWIDIPIWREVRTFIRNKKMKAMTQYFSSSFFPNVTMEEYQSMKRIILEYFEKVKDQIPLDDCCIDFVVIDLEKEIVKIIELNSFGDNCGPAFFNWDSDRLLLYNGCPLEFRIATNSTIEKDYQLA